MADVRVKCINKQPRNDTHEGITHLGGDGWKWTRQQVADSIRAKTNTFYTLVGGPGQTLASSTGRAVRTCGRTPTASGTTIFSP